MWFPYEDNEQIVQDMIYILWW